jgi:hypothetical protein
MGSNCAVTFAQIASYSLKVLQKPRSRGRSNRKTLFALQGRQRALADQYGGSPGPEYPYRRGERPAAVPYAASLTGRNAHQPSRQSTVQVGDNRAGFSCLSSESKRSEAVGKVSPFSRTMVTSYPGRYCWLQETHSREWL